MSLVDSDQESQVTIGAAAFLDQGGAQNSQGGATCTHHWVIEAPYSGCKELRGTCRICHAEKLFPYKDPDARAGGAFQKGIDVERVWSPAERARAKAVHEDWQERMRAAVSLVAGKDAWVPTPNNEEFRAES